jgi:antibiotic biosynthesis monooxygenase (ABM) superfamily enzyme
MVTMITLHLVNKEKREQAMALLKKNTELAAKAKGLILRQVLFSQKNPLKGYSITAWETKENMEAFLISPERPPLVTEVEEGRVYEKTPEGNVLLFTYTDTEIYELVYSS